MTLNADITPSAIPHKKIIGNPNRVIIGVNDDAVVEDGDLTWLSEHSSLRRLSASGCSAILVNDKFVECDEIKDKTLIVVDSPIDVFESLALRFLDRHNDHPKIGESSVIEKTAVIGPNVIIGENCYIGNNVVIAQGTVVDNGVVIHDNSVVGATPFSYMRRAADATLRKRLIFGNVYIESDVEIGANSTIARGITSATTIGAGTKTDCHVHIGHDVHIGENCLLCSYVGIAGYTLIGDNCSFWAKSGAVQRIRVADNTTVMATSVLTKNVVVPNTRLVGNPARPSMQYWRNR